MPFDWRKFPLGNRAQRTCLTVASTFVLAAQLAAYVSEPEWGKPIHGLRLGIAAEMASPESESRLLATLENTGDSNLTILLGASSGNGPVYNLTFSARNAQGKACEVLNLTGGPGVGGFVSPLTVELAPGKRYEIGLPMKKLICVANRTDLALDVLLRRRFSVSASLRVDDQGAAWANLIHPWLGIIRSGDLAIAEPLNARAPTFIGRIDERCTVQFGGWQCDGLGCVSSALITYESQGTPRTEVVQFRYLSSDEAAGIPEAPTAQALLQLGRQGWQLERVSLDSKRGRQAGVIYHLKRQTSVATKG